MRWLGYKINCNLRRYLLISELSAISSINQNVAEISEQRTA